MTPGNTAMNVYADSVRGLPLDEQLRLAALILQELSQPGVAVVELSETWSPQDEREVTTFALQHAASLYPEAEELV